MCLILFAWQSHPEYPLVVAANRDEFYARKTRPAAWWGQAVSLLAGRDEEAGGTWFGINRHGRFAMLTNVRAPAERNPHAPTRGSLVMAALQSDEPPPQWFAKQQPRANNFNGYNLIIGDVAPFLSHGAAVTYGSNRLPDAPRMLTPGIYGLSNGFLDTPWPKVTKSVSRFATQIASRINTDAFFALMADRRLAPDSELPSTGVPLDWERALSAVQIRAQSYGTRTTTVLTVRGDGLATFVERSFDTQRPELFADRCYEFVIDGMNVRDGLGLQRDA